MSGYHKREFETFPVHKLKRVQRPTTLILDDKVQRVDERESGFNKAVRGDYGDEEIMGKNSRQKGNDSFPSTQPPVPSHG